MLQKHWHWRILHKLKKHIDSDFHYHIRPPINMFIISVKLCGMSTIQMNVNQLLL